jgi:hypothetical protein
MRSLHCSGSSSQIVHDLMRKGVNMYSSTRASRFVSPFLEVESKELVMKRLGGCCTLGDADLQRGKQRLQFKAQALTASYRYCVEAIDADIWYCLYCVRGALAAAHNAAERR